jgi:serine/threonine protein kinase
MQTACGTPEYLAPELVAILSRRSKTKSYSYKVDVWAVGVILYVMLCGFHPFYHDNQLKLYMAILSGDFAYPSPYWDTIREETKDFIKLLLQTDPDKRPSAAECLQHSWLIDVHSLNSSSISASNVAKLDSYNQRRHQKFKKGVHAVIAANRFAKMLGKPGMAATASSGAPTQPTTIEPIKE